MNFRDTTKSPTTPPLDRGLYRVSVVGDCYQAECELDLRQDHALEESTGNSHVTCQGDELYLTKSLGDLYGVGVPGALRTVNVRIVRDGKPLYDGAIEQGCSKLGFCVDPFGPL